MYHNISRHSLTSQKKNSDTELSMKRKKSIIWTTDKINSLLEDMNNHGLIPVTSPFFMNDRDYRDANILFQLTDKEKEEFIKCSSDCIYFISHYVQFENDHGSTLVRLRDYQLEFIHKLSDEYWDPEIKEFAPKIRYLISMQSRQLGKTTTTAAFFLWYMIFHSERHLAIVANKGETVKEIIRKFTNMLKGLPFFMKPGIVKKNMSFISFDNGTFMQGFATTKTPSIGFTIHILYIDEAALIPVNIMESFWLAIFPTLSSSKISKLIITSTPRGKKNRFYQIWDAAVKHENSFATFKAYWWQVPEHDEKWAAPYRKDFGPEYFAQEFDLKFDIETDKLIRSSDMRFLERIKTEYETVDLPVMPKEISDKFFWNKSFNPLSILETETSRFLLSVDTAEGCEQWQRGKRDPDYNIINIFKGELMNPANVRKFTVGNHITVNDCFRFRQVGVYIDNTKDEEFLAHAMKYLVYDIFRSGYRSRINPNLFLDNVRILLEMNYNGKNVLNIFMDNPGFYEDIVIKTYHRKPIPGENQQKKFGYKTATGSSETGRGKKHFCEETMRMITRRQIIPTHFCKNNANCSTYDQLGDFAKVFNKMKTNYTYKGVDLHDDIVMTVMNLSRAFDKEEQPEFTIWLQDYLDMLPLTKRKQLIQKLLNQAELESEDIESKAIDALIGSNKENNNDHLFPQVNTNPYLMKNKNIVNPYLKHGNSNPYLKKSNTNPYLKAKPINPYLKKRF